MSRKSIQKELTLKTISTFLILFIGFFKLALFAVSVARKYLWGANTEKSTIHFDKNDWILFERRIIQEPKWIN